jgi:Lrp/AsnC family transcriptional regulator, leucine-responsive regulatory protein
MKINKSHIDILNHLRHDARRSFTTISRKTDIPITTVFDNYHRLSSDGIIKKHTSIVDFRKLGFNYRNFIFLKAKNRSELLDFLDSKPCVNSIFKISGYDFLVDAVFPGMKEFYSFMDELSDRGVVNMEMHDVIDSIKSEEFFAKRH